MTTIAEDSPAYFSPKYTELKRGWDFVRLMRRLNRSIEDRPGDVIPRGADEGARSHRTRVRLTFGFEAIDETIHGLTGLAMRHDPVLKEDVPERLRREWEDWDLQGTHGAVFLTNCLDQALADGHGAILVDHPPFVEGLTLEDEARMGRRAYVVHVPIDRITAWRTDRILGRRVISMVKLEENRMTSSGRFGAKAQRVMRTFVQRVEAVGTPERPLGTPYVEWFEDVESAADGKTAWVTTNGTLHRQRWIPLFPFYGGVKKGILDSDPPLLGMAYASKEHTQKKSQRSYSEHRTAIAMPVWIGRIGAGSGDAVRISSDLGVDVSVGGDAKFMEGGGVALSPLLEDMRDLERLMGSQGFSMLRRSETVAATATEKELQANREESKLARAVRSVHDAAEAALASIAEYYGLVDEHGTGRGGSIEMSRNFDDLTLSNEDTQVLMDLEERGKITHKTLLLQLQSGGRYLQDVDIDQEVAEARRENLDEPLTDDPDA